MILQIKDIFDIASSSRDFSYVIPVNELAEYKGYTFISPIAINGFNASTNFTRARLLTTVTMVVNRTFHLSKLSVCSLLQNQPKMKIETAKPNRAGPITQKNSTLGLTGDLAVFQNQPRPLTSLYLYRMG